MGAPRLTDADDLLDDSRRFRLALAYDGKHHSALGPPERWCRRQARVASSRVCVGKQCAMGCPARPSSLRKPRTSRRLLSRSRRPRSGRLLRRRSSTPTAPACALPRKGAPAPTDADDRFDDFTPPAPELASTDRARRQSASRQSGRGAMSDACFSRKARVGNPVDALVPAAPAAYARRRATGATARSCVSSGPVARSALTRVAARPRERAARCAWRSS